MYARDVIRQMRDPGATPVEPHVQQTGGKIRMRAYAWRIA